MEDRWLPADWDRMDEQRKIEFLTAEEIRLAEQIVSEFPQNEDALVVLGNVHRKYGNSDQAIACWEKVLTMNPDRMDAYDGMAMVAMEKGRHDQAVEIWNTGLARKPETPEFRNSIAQALSRAGRHEEAIAILKEETRRFPFSATAYYLLGQEYAQQQEYASARSCYEKAVDLNPDHTNAYYGLMMACMRLQLTSEAKTYKARFDVLKQRDTRDLRDTIRGRDDLRRSTKSLADTLLSMEAIYRRSGDARLARESLRRIAMMDPEHVRLLARQAEMLRGQGRLAEALTIHEKIANEEPNNSINLFNMAGICIDLKRFDLARDSLLKVTKQSPGFDGAFRELARIDLIQGRDSVQARQWAERAIQAAPSAANYFVYSWACDKTGDRPGAIAALKRAVELEPNNPVYQDKYRIATMGE